MKKLTSFAILAASIFSLTFATTASAEAHSYHNKRPTTVVVHKEHRYVAPRVVTRRVAPKFVITIPGLFATHKIVMSAPPPLRSYAQVYRARLGAPRQVYVESFRTVHGRYVPGYWTWMY